MSPQAFLMIIDDPDNRVSTIFLSLLDSVMQNSFVHVLSRASSVHSLKRDILRASMN